MNYISRLNQHLGAQIFERALKESGNEDWTRPSIAKTTAHLVALAIILTPYIVGLLGMILMLGGFANLWFVALGLIVLATGLHLRPKRQKNTYPTLRRTDAPSLFALLDQISSRLACSHIDGVQVIGEMNAYMAEYESGEKVVGIGGPLWSAATQEERIALLAHELAHLANGDPARSRLPRVALHTLDRWISIFSPPNLRVSGCVDRLYFEDRYWFERVISELLGSAVGALAYSYEKLIFAGSQKAEYLADLLGAGIAGKGATLAMLDKLNLIPLAEKRVAKLYYDGSRHIPIFKEMAAGITSHDPAEAARLRQEAANELHCIDASHPPTRYRIEFIRRTILNDSPSQLENIDWAGIENELAASFRREEEKSLATMLVQ